MGKNPRANVVQTLGQRIRWLRAYQRPPMTQRQLADTAGVALKTIIDLERDKGVNFQLFTINHIGNALGCQVYINFKRRGGRSRPNLRPGRTCLPEVASLPIVPELPPVPECFDKSSGKDLERALRTLRYPWKAVYQRKLFARRIKTSGTGDKKNAEPETEDKPREPPGTP